MNTLDKTIRNLLKQTITEAREAAEAAAKSAIEQLGVDKAKPFEHLSDSQKKLRRRLRAHARQLGDERNEQTDEQSISILIEEVAYEHWNRMLFSRFLAENNLLIHPDALVPVSLDECDELAREQGDCNGWELAAQYAARMLPQVFRIDSPAFELKLSPERQQQLEQLLTGLPQDVFTASDSLGWAYQFWQEKRKTEINKSEVKIGARELPAVTQLFTEPYMVSFLLDNALGAWWANRVLSQLDFSQAQSEEELRTKAAIEGVPLTYLRFIKGENGWSTAAGTFDMWPDHLSDLKTLDPCCGSGHFLIAAFHMLVPMRMQLESLTATEAVDAVLRNNIHGLELDRRCVEVAAFALALAAWTYPGTNGYRPLPAFNIACSGIASKAARDEWKQVAKDKRTLAAVLGWVYEAFQDAPVLGSLIDPKRIDGVQWERWPEVKTALEEIMANEANIQNISQQEDDLFNKQEDHEEAAVVVQGMAKSINMLMDKYQWVITNVPYLAIGKQAERLSSFCKKYYPEGKNDLATVFLDRCIEYCVHGGTVSCV